MTAAAAAAGIADHCGWAVVVCVSTANDVVDVRRIDLIESGLPRMPHHGPGQRLEISQAVALVERVRRSAETCARKALDELPQDVGAIVIRKRPALPPTVAERIESYWAQTRADGVMYRDALAAAASDRGWLVCEYDAKTVLGAAAEALAPDKDIADWLEIVGKIAGPPWGRDQRLAAAAALVAAGQVTGGVRSS